MNMRIMPMFSDCATKFHVRGNPAMNLDVLSRWRNMLLIVKDGKVYKNTLNE